MAIAFAGEKRALPKRGKGFYKGMKECLPVTDRM